MSEIKTYAESIFDELVAIRRDIHAHPEVGMTEVRTSDLIRKELEKMGMDEVQSPLPTAATCTPPCCWGLPRRCATCGTPSPVR